MATCDAKRTAKPIGWKKPLSRLTRENDGSVAVIFGLSASVLIGLVGGAIDYAKVVSARTHLQSAVDAGVLAGGNALKLVVSSTDSIVGLTTQTIQAEAKAGPDAEVSIQVSVAGDKTSVEARAEQVIKLTFGTFVGMASIPISARARASVVGRMRLCMLALDPAASGAFNLERNAQVTAYDCALYSNSTSRSGMVGRDGALARAQTICSAGDSRTTGRISRPTRRRAAPSSRIRSATALPRRSGAV
ncbi:hypothetical protein GCM10025880_06770 [Methylorubrum aminovorans]|uniref:TadE/TadG family type IV pilus assembly protein n=1 Tax=Methylorubrum aminovorans TaxID=269069 RepID=UPI0023EA248C|nr:Tad domain-containing protein [Methylorubrum aminovorans]GMA74260.1 hypothetical protein GCM10025880_06770 [Methylorubrum aminovorans]